MVLTLGKVLWQYASKDEDVIQYTNSIIDIVSLILNIQELNNEAKGTITSNDIMMGKVDGTLTKEMLEKTSRVEIYTSLEDIDNSLKGDVKDADSN